MAGLRCPISLETRSPMHIVPCCEGMIGGDCQHRGGCDACYTGACRNGFLRPGSSAVPRVPGLGELTVLLLHVLHSQRHIRNRYITKAEVRLGSANMVPGSVAGFCHSGALPKRRSAVGSSFDRASLCGGRGTVRLKYLGGERLRAVEPYRTSAAELDEPPIMSGMGMGRCISTMSKPQVQMQGPTTLKPIPRAKDSNCSFDISDINCRKWKALMVETIWTEGQWPVCDCVSAQC